MCCNVKYRKLIVSHTYHRALYHSVYSAGEGFGCTFTVKIPLMDTPALTRDVSVAADEDLRQSLSRRSSYVHGCLDFAKMNAHNVSFNSLVSLTGEIDLKAERNHQISALNGIIDTDGQSDYTLDCSMRSGAPNSSTLSSPVNPYALVSSGRNPISICASSPVSSPSPCFFSQSRTRCYSDHFDILIVDDSKLNRKMLSRSLKASSHRCDEAEDGGEAVEMVKRKWLNEGGMYDVILMDFMMPKMDGPTATGVLREQGYSGVIIGVTGNALPSDINHFMEKGADKVFLKPVDVDALQSALLSLLNPC